MSNKVKTLKDSAPTAATKSLTVVSQDSYADWLATQATDAQKKYCATPGFNGKAGQVQAVYKNDVVDHYIAVVADVGSPHSYSGLPKKLPAGEYQLTASSADIDADNLALGWALGTYSFDVFLDKVPAKKVLLVPPQADKAMVTRLSEVIYQTRDIINLPTNILGVAALTHRAQTLANKFNAVANVTVVQSDKDFPLLWHVGKAAAESPRMFDMKWGNGAPSNINLTLIGKGVVYDSGGLALKPRDGMLTMKKDMGGAAHAMALAELIMSENLPVNLRLILPIVENSINERALRNGDVIMSRGDKKSVEIVNTDAEGRLILADALDLAGEGSVKPDLIIDFATLTAAARTVGEPGTAVIICNDKKVARELEDISQEIDDRLQAVTLDPRNAYKVGSQIADLANSGTSLPSHVFAAHFLNAFSPKGVTRVHVDQGAWGPDGAKDEGLRATYAFVRRKALGL
ncbi:MAG: leucyl aminopeptidase family protein [Alphaproteobacteria bacterium]|nr:leucyl aminopeptidase family protein [Alphaproteobacteria bacterium]